MDSFFTADRIVLFLFSVIRTATPLIYGAMAAVITFKAGLTNLGIESMMLASALAGVFASAATQSVWVGVLAGVVTSVITTLVISYFAFVLKTDLYLTGIAMNMALVGGTVFAMFIAVGVKSNTAGHLASLVVPSIDIPLLKDIPFLGSVLSGHNLLTYGAFLSVAVVWFLIQRTRIGLRIRAVGENPQAATSVGISVRKIYFFSFAISGLFAGLGGVFMSMAYVSWFSRDMVAGRGLIAMSAMNIGNGQPLGSAISAFIFGISTAVSNNLTMVNISPQLVFAFPYLATIALIAILSFYRINRQRYRMKKKLSSYDSTPTIKE